MAAGRFVSFSVLAVLVAACSGAGNEDLFESGQQSDTASNEPAPATTATGTPGKTSPPATPGTPDTKPPGTETTPPENAVCTPEREPNNDMARATLFTSSLCGKIDSATDVDFGRFVAPPTATSMEFKHSEKNGRVSYRFFVGNVPVQPDGDSLQVIPGATYNVQMRLPQNSGGDRPTYELEVSFK